MKTVNRPVRKKDAMQLLTGQPVYTDDIAPKDCLIVKLLRSPHANAVVETIRTDIAKKVPGIEAIYTWEDIPQDGRRYTIAGQTYPEASPYDRLILDRHVRYVGDPVAIVAGEDEKAVDKALSLIKVTYEVLEPVLDFRKAKDAPILVHPEENWESLCPVGAENKRNLCAHEESGSGDIEAVLADCDLMIDRVYHTKACQQTMMETFRTFCTIDAYGRLHVVSSTQIVFHCRRIIANALHIPKSMVRVGKPRIGGGFGAKQTAVSEVYPAFVTWKTKKPSKIIFTREESMTASTPRHEMEIRIRLGAMKNGWIRGIDMYTLSNTGAYGEHGPTTVGLTGHKAIPLYGRAEAFHFDCDVVYTNVMAAGAYRGYGATQGLFAVESAVNELAAMLKMDPFRLRELNIVREGEVMPAYFDQVNSSCALDRCLKKVHEMIRWEEKYPVRDMGNGKVRSVGMGMALQGSGIAGLDVGSATLRLGDENTYNLTIGAADMGTGCDTILAQIAAEVLDCDLDNIMVFGADTDASPYDSGSYASSTTYVTGKAVELCALKLREQICRLGAKLLHCEESQVEFDGKKVYALSKSRETLLEEEETKAGESLAEKRADAGESLAEKESDAEEPLAEKGTDVSEPPAEKGTDVGESLAKKGEDTGESLAEKGTDVGESQETGTAAPCVSLEEIAAAAMSGNEISLEAAYTHSSPISPPPFMVGAVELETDLLTGEVKVIEFDACVDCGTPVNPNLARVQAEGGIVQGIGMALTENITYDGKGRVSENSLMQYKIPTRLDMGEIHVEFESSYEDTGPFGAKSIGEIVINTPLPSIADALYHATGHRYYELPITPEQIAMAAEVLEKEA